MSIRNLERYQAVRRVVNRLDYCAIKREALTIPMIEHAVVSARRSNIEILDRFLPDMDPETAARARRTIENLRAQL